MKKLFNATLLIALSTSSFAMTQEQREIQEKENLKLLEQMGLPVPGSGIKFVDRSALNLSEEDLLKGQREETEMRDKGYITTYANRAQELINLESLIKKRPFTSKKKLNPMDTDIMPHVEDIQLAFKYQSLDQQKSLRSSGTALHYLAAAPQGGFHKDLGGWSGVAQFFKVPTVGVCDYSIMNVKASNTAAWLVQEDVQYLVNNKPSFLRVEGSDDSGYLYQVKWYDDIEYHELQCANMSYSLSLTDSLIQLAKKIDIG